MHGFLYFRAPSQNHPAYVQIGFRVIADNDPTSFLRGHDLVYDKGYVWYLPAAVVATRAQTNALLCLLLRDGLLDAREIAEMRELAVSPRARLKHAIPQTLPLGPCFRAGFED